MKGLILVYFLFLMGVSVALSSRFFHRTRSEIHRRF